MNREVVQARGSARGMRALGAEECEAVSGGWETVLAEIPADPPCPLVAVVRPDGTIHVTHACDGEPVPPDPNGALI